MVDETKKIFWTFEKISSPYAIILRLVGLIPFQGRKLNFIGTYLVGIFFHAVNMIYTTMFLGYGIRMILQKNFEIDYICEQFVVNNICFRYLILYYKRKELVRLMNMCKELWSYITPEESSIVRIYERKAYYIRIIILISATSATTIFIITDYFSTNLTVNGTETKTLTFRFYVEVHDEPLFTIISTFQTIVIYFETFVVAGIETVGLYFILMASSYLRVVYIRLTLLMEIQKKTIFNDNKKYRYKMNKFIFNNVRACANFHQKIMGFCEEMERFMRSVYLVSVSTTIYNMSIIGVKLLENDKKNIIYVVLFVMNLFIFFFCQWCPEYLLEESAAIAHAAYFASLNETIHQIEIDKILCLMIMRAQRPIQLTAGGYIKLSMESFGTMVKSAFSFFAVLRKIKN